MNVRAIVLFGLYMAVVLVAGGLLVYTIGANCLAAEARVARATDKDTLPCDVLTRTLDNELWAWFVNDVRTLGPQAHKRTAYPGVLAEWEAARRNGEARCTEKEATKLAALENVRRRLEATSYLLSQNAGGDIALLRE